MNTFPIRNDQDLARAFARIDALWSAEPGTPEADELDVFVTLVEAYESAHSTLSPGNPIAVLRYKLDELGISQRELGRRLGWSTGRVSEILNRRRPLTLPLIRQLASELAIPTASLMGEQTAHTEGDVALVPIAANLAKQIGAVARQAGCSLSSWVEAAVLRALPASDDTRTSAADFGRPVLIRPQRQTSGARQAR